MADINDNEYATKLLGKYLVVSQGTLQNAVKRQGQLLKTGQSVKTIGEMLVESGDITQEELETAIKKQRKDRIRECPVFSILSETELSAISNKFTEVTVQTGEQFIIQDTPDPVLYILCAGKVEVYRTDLEGNFTHIAYVEPPQPIGEMGYFQGGVQTASIRAVETTQLLKADYDTLTHYFENVPSVAHAFMKMVENRRAATQEALKED